MPSSEARVAIDQPVRYMTQLCKHFQHKIPVTLDERQGSIQFQSGPCRVTAGETELTLQVSAATEEALAQLEDVVARHLLRFAFREPPAIRWERGSG